MLKATKTDKKPKAPIAPKAKTKAKARKDIPARNLRMIAILDQWLARPEPSEEEQRAWEETMKSLDESRPHRPLFS